MCVPCVAPALPVFLELFGAILFGLLIVVAFVLRKGVHAVPFVALGLYRWFSGAVLIKDLGVPDRVLPTRRWARHVHAVVRAFATVSVVLGVMWPMYLYALSVLAVGSVVGVGAQRALIWRTQRVKLAGAPIKVKAQVRS
jgi:hypothetical protein